MLQRFIMLSALVSFILHSDSAWAMEIKPHLHTALDTLESDILPQVMQVLSQLL